MEIPIYDFNEDENTNFKQLYKYMPKSNFRMRICGNSGSGKTNLFYHIHMKPLVYYDQIHLYGKNLEQEKYRHMIETMNDISGQAGYDIMHCNNDDIKPGRGSIPVSTVLRKSVRYFIIDIFLVKTLNLPS